MFPGVGDTSPPQIVSPAQVWGRGHSARPGSCRLAGPSLGASSRRCHQGLWAGSPSEGSWGLGGGRVALPQAAPSPAPLPVGPLSPVSKARKGQVLDRALGPWSRAHALHLCNEFLVRSSSCVESREGASPALPVGARGAERGGGRAGCSGHPPHRGLVGPQHGWEQKAGRPSNQWLCRPEAGPWARAWASPPAMPSLHREPVAPPGGRARLPAGLRLGARVQQRAPCVRGAPGPGLGSGPWGARAPLPSPHCHSPLPPPPPAPQQSGPGLQQVCLPGLGHRQQSPGQPQPEPGNRVSPHGRAATAAHRAGLGLRHRGEPPAEGGRPGQGSKGTLCVLGPPGLQLAWVGGKPRRSPQGSPGPSRLGGWALPPDPLPPQ